MAKLDGTGEHIDETHAPGVSRRSMIRGAAALGFAIPALGVFRGGAAQDAQPTPVGDAIGSDAGASQGTGDASPMTSAVEVPFTLYDPFLAPVSAGTKDIVVTAKDAVVQIARDVRYAGWTYDGSIPGRALRVVEGDTVNFTFKIDPTASTGHSMDFHSAKTPPNVNYKTIMPGEELSYAFVPKHAGAYMYHCGTPPVLMHIGAGMYGAMIVDPKEGWSPAQELVFVQSDFYIKDGDNGVKVPDYTRMLGYGQIDYVTFNGYANQYVENPIVVKVGEPVRIFVVNCGPNVWSSFHVVGTIFDKAYVNANPNNLMQGLQSITIGPGDGAMVEFTLDEPGTYPAVNHAFGHAAQGAIALIKAE